MKTRLLSPDRMLLLPTPPTPDQDGLNSDQVEWAKAISDFSKEALEANTTNLSKSMKFIDESFLWLRWAYTGMLIAGGVIVLAAIFKGLTADSGSDAAATAVLGGVSLGVVFGALILKPVESTERNAIFVPWMLLALNTYWTRLVYMKDPKKIDSQLEDAAKDAAEQFKAITEVHAGALKSENERLAGLQGGKKDGEGAKGDEDKDKGKENGKKAAEGNAGGAVSPPPAGATDRPPATR